MPPEIVALIEKPHLFVTVLVLGAVVGMMVERFATETRRRAWRQKNRGRWKTAHRGNIADGPWPSKSVDTPPKQPDAADQLRIVMGAEFSIQPLLNKSEARLFKELDRIVSGCRPGWQVMAQVSLGEILRCRDSEAYRCINSKRVDLLLVDENCGPRHRLSRGRRRPHYAIGT